MPASTVRTVLVTGATNGIGLETCAALARGGHHVVMVGRDPMLLDSALREVQQRSAHTHHEDPSQVTTMLCDLASLGQVRILAERFLVSHDRLDVLINNAATLSPARRTTQDGLEETFAVNHLAHFLLTNLLTHVLVASAPARVITLTSNNHLRAGLDIADLEYEHGYTMRSAYFSSKLANVLFANELARRLHGTGVTSNSVHPGTAGSNLWSHARWWSKARILIEQRPAYLTSEEAAMCVVRLALDSDLDGVTGTYFDGVTPAETSPLALDDALARKLWDISAQMVGGVPEL